MTPLLRQIYRNFLIEKYKLRISKDGRFTWYKWRLGNQWAGFYTAKWSDFSFLGPYVVEVVNERDY